MYFEGRRVEISAPSAASIRAVVHTPFDASRVSGGREMGLDVSLLRENFALVLHREPRLATRFYRHLFSRRPEAASMFHRSPRAVQERMLTDALVAIMDHIDDAPWLRERLYAMGAKHVEYGVTPAMYAWVGEALVATLADVSGAAWSAPVERAWREAYDVIASMVLAGAAPPRSAR